jgi:hypothetical protein
MGRLDDCKQRVRASACILLLKAIEGQGETNVTTKVVVVVATKL